MEVEGNREDRPEVLWMEGISRGDHEAFRCLVERYQRQILNLAYRYCGDRQISEDLTQDVFLKVYLNAARWRPEGGDFAAWLHRIAVNHCLNFRRGPHRREIHAPDQPEGPDHWRSAEGGGSNPNAGPSPELLLDRKQEARRILEALAELPGRQRMAVILQRFHDLSYKEIAVRMDCSEKAVESLLVRATNQLRKRLAEGG